MISGLVNACQWLRSLIRRRDLEDGLDEEIRFHIDRQVEKNLRAGMTSNDARRQALISFTMATEHGIRYTFSICALALTASVGFAQSPGPDLPAEAAGLDQIVRTLIGVFDQADILALGEDHGRQEDSDLRIALVRHPEFAKKVQAIVVEFASTTEQATLDRYIQGENVSRAQLERVWKTTTQARNGVWDAPIYADFFSAVRDVNTKLPAESRIRIFGGDPGPGDNRSREIAALAVLKEQVLQKRAKALVIYGAAHFYRAAPADYLASMGQDVGLARMLDADYRGRTFVVIPLGGPADRLPPGIAMRDPDYAQFDRAITTPMRPVLVPLKRSPFRELKAEEFLGAKLLTCRGGCRSVFKDSPLTLGEIADACVYFGNSAAVGTTGKDRLRPDLR
jgi:hypothetical protein